MLEWLILSFCLGNLVVTFHRSGIPVKLEGTVTKIEMRREKHPGLDDVYLVRVGDRTMHLDTDLGRHIRKGDRVSKRRWQSTLQTPRGPVRLHPSKDFWRMLIWMPVLWRLSYRETTQRRST